MQEEAKKEEEIAGDGRDDQGRWVKGVSGNPEGMKPMTDDEKLRRAAQKKVIAEYTDQLTQALIKISPVLIAKAIEGDLGAIKEINDRALGKPRQNIGLDGGGDDKPIEHKITVDELSAFRKAIIESTEEAGRGE